MSRLHVALQEGFAGDTVVCRINDRDVYRKEGLRTRLQIGHADSFECEVPDGRAEVEISIENRGLKERLAPEVSGDTYIGVSVNREGVIEHKVQKTPFGYL